jgi:diguanylate cyclase (GGDEF)-like protein
MNRPRARNSTGTSDNEIPQGSSGGDGQVAATDTDQVGLARSCATDSVEPVIEESVLVISSDGTIITMHSPPEGVPRDQATKLIGRPVESLWSGKAATLIRTYIRRTLRGRQVHSAELEDLGNGRHFEFIFVAQGPDRVLVIVRDNSERKSAISEMQQLAYIDAVTGLPNQKYLHNELNRITDSLRLKGGRAAVICIDIDKTDFENIAPGKTKQDAVLKELATRLMGGLRGVNQPDTPDEERYSIAVRVDFRQFAVVLPIIEDGSDAEAVTSRLAGSLEQPINIGTSIVRVAVNAGIALFPQDGTDAMTLLENAHAAMEDAKNSQTMRPRFHSGTIRARALKRQDMELELQAALDREEFHLKYLPIVDAGTRIVRTAEALLRWPQEVFGSRPIQQVISLAEHTGLIVPIGEWVLRHSCEQLHAWHASGHSELRLAVNLSAQEFSRADLASRVAEILGASSIEPRHVDFEITEHILFRDALRDFAMCRDLKELGVGVVVDDYGTGACSLAHLTNSPVDTVKIDGGFVAHSETNPSDRAACAAATAMAHELSLKVVAESVETEEQAMFMQELGCDFLQGFLFCRPSLASEFTEYLASASKGQ